LAIVALAPSKLKPLKEKIKKIKEKTKYGLHLWGITTFLKGGAIDFLSKHRNIDG